MARAVCRLVAPDEIFQCFTRDASTKSNKKPFSVLYPRVHQIITAVVISNADIGINQALSGISAHLAQCGDRRKSKLFREALGATENIQ